MRSRIKFAIGFVIIFLVEVWIALFVHDQFIRPYVGDMLVVIVLYFFIKMCFLIKSRWLPGYLFVLAVGVEMLQYFQVAEWLGVAHLRVVQLLMGSVFDWKDIICYGVGCFLLWVGESLMISRTPS